MNVKPATAKISSLALKHNLQVIKEKAPRSKIIAVVPSDVPDTTRPLAAIDDDAKAMSQHLIKFFEQEIAEGRLPKNLLPLQSGVGSVANAVISGLAKGPFTDLSILGNLISN